MAKRKRMKRAYLRNISYGYMQRVHTPNVIVVREYARRARELARDASEDPPAVFHGDAPPRREVKARLEQLKAEQRDDSMRRILLDTKELTFSLFLMPDQRAFFLSINRVKGTVSKSKIYRDEATAMDYFNNPGRKITWDKVEPIGG